MDEPQHINLPFIIPDEGGRRWLPRTPEPLGEWVAWNFDDWKGWTLKVHPVFEAQIRQRRPGAYEFSVNSGAAKGERDTLEAAQRACEEAIVQMVRAMLPAYRVMHARVTGHEGPLGQGCTQFGGRRSWDGVTDLSQVQDKKAGER